MQDEKGSLSEAFAAFQRKPKLPGQSGATKGKEGLPIRLGGDVRGGSLGDLRAAVGGFPLDPRNWQAPSRTGDCTVRDRRRRSSASSALASVASAASVATSALHPRSPTEAT